MNITYILLDLKVMIKSMGTKTIDIVDTKIMMLHLHDAGTFNYNPKKNTIPPWFLPCTCGPQRCHYNVRLKDRYIDKNFSPLSKPA
jgi:hypothetical protein